MDPGFNKRHVTINNRPGMTGDVLPGRSGMVRVDVAGRSAGWGGVGRNICLFFDLWPTRVYSKLSFFSLILFFAF